LNQISASLSNKSVSSHAFSLKPRGNMKQAQNLTEQFHHIFRDESYEGKVGAFFVFQNYNSIYRRTCLIE